MKRTVDMFPKIYAPRKVRMHVLDAGELAGGGKGIRFRCDACGHDTGWIPDHHTVSSNKKGRPCPECNKNP